MTDKISPKVLDKISSKNTLQELFQKAGMKPPVYNTYRAGGPPHAPLFLCELALPTGEIYCTKNPYPTKKDAERAVAEMALETMDSLEEKIDKKVPNIIRLHAEEPILILVDIENVSKDFNTISQGSNVDIVGYVGKNHHLANLSSEKLASFPYKIKIVPSALPDAADTQIICHCTRAYDANYYKEIIVVTKDHYGDCLCALFDRVRQHGSIERLVLDFCHD